MFPLTAKLLADPLTPYFIYSTIELETVWLVSHIFQSASSAKSAGSAKHVCPQITQMDADAVTLNFV